MAGEELHIVRSYQRIFHYVSERDKVHNRPAINAAWGYVANRFNGCAWIKKTKADPDRDHTNPSHGCSDANQIFVDSFASLLNCNFCNAGWPVKVKNDGVPMFRNIPPRDAKTDAELAPYTVPGAILEHRDRIHWRWVSRNGKWVAIWAELITQGGTGSKWGFVRLADLKQDAVSPGAVKGSRLCKGATPHVPHGVRHPIDERWPLVCAE